MRDHGALAKRDEQADSILPLLLDGYRFTVCRTPAEAARALDVRRRVYGASYDVPVPDEYDGRSWLLLAEDTRTGQAVGTLRMTPRFAGRLECEEYFTLPRSLATPASVELNRFAILPEYRKGKTFLPSVSLGLFKMVWLIMRKIGARYMVVASKAERIWTYEWLCFSRTGLTARYEKLANAGHELLAADFRAVSTLEGHPFKEFFVDIDYPECIVPIRLPGFGLVSGGNERPAALVVNG